MATGKIAFPAIAGNIITWWEDYYVRDEETARKPAALRARDIGTMSAPAVLAQTPKTTYGFGPSKMSSTWIVYSKASGAAKVQKCWELEAVRTSGGTPVAISNLGCNTPRFDIIGDRLSYINDEERLVTKSLDRGSSTPSGPHGAPHT